LVRAKKTPARSKKPETGSDSKEQADETITKNDEKGGPHKEAVVLEDPIISISETPDAVAEAAKAPAASEIPAVVPEQRSGLFPMLLGGFVAAGLGFGASQFLGNDAWPFSRGPSATDELKQVVEQQKARIATIQASVEELTNTVNNPVADPRIDDLVVTMEGTQEFVNKVSGRLEGLDARVGDLENRPIPDIGATVDAVAAYERELAAMRAMFQEELARIEAAQNDAVQIEQSATIRAESAAARAAFARVKAAVETGAPLVSALDAVRDVGKEIPLALSENAESGVLTLAQLQQEFPAAARAALSASINASVDTGAANRFTAFLRTQLGTRSLQPREGDDPDAILSRAEGALRGGEIKNALNELGGLAEPGKSEMADWIAAATTQQQAVAAVSALAKTMNN